MYTYEYAKLITTIAFTGIFYFSYNISRGTSTRGDKTITSLQEHTFEKYTERHSKEISHGHYTSVLNETYYGPKKLRKRKIGIRNGECQFGRITLDRVFYSADRKQIISTSDKTVLSETRGFTRFSGDTLYREVTTDILYEINSRNGWPVSGELGYGNRVLFQIVFCFLLFFFKTPPLHIYTYTYTIHTITDLYYEQVYTV